METKIDWQANRATRRIFKKRFGAMLPPRCFPHVKSDGYAKCKCTNCNDRRVRERAVASVKEKKVIHKAKRGV